MIAVQGEKGMSYGIPTLYIKVVFIPCQMDRTWRVHDKKVRA